MRKGSRDVEKLKVDLTKSSSSLQSALSTNISLTNKNKTSNSDNTASKSKLRS